MAFKIRRGTNAERLTIIPAQGELIYTTDTKKLYVGDGTTTGGNAVDDMTGIATTSYVDQKIDDLVDGAATTLNTLKELADALGSDPNFANNITTAISNKLDNTDTSLLSPGDMFFTKTNNTVSMGSLAAQTITAGPNGIQIASTGGVEIMGAASAQVKIGGGSSGTIVFNSQTSGISYNDLSNTPTGMATESYVDNAVSNLVNSAPTTLDTLKELADALGQDQNFATTISTSLANKANVADLSLVATSGDYGDLINKPTIPADVSDLTDTNTLLWDRTTITDNLIPDTNVTYDIGSPTNRFKDIYLSSNTIYLGETALGIDPVKGLQVKSFGGGEGYGAGSVEWLDSGPNIYGVDHILKFNGVDISHPLYTYLSNLKIGDQIKEAVPPNNPTYAPPADFLLTVTGPVQFVNPTTDSFGSYINAIIPVDQSRTMTNVGSNYYVYYVEFRNNPIRGIDTIPDPDGILPQPDPAGWPYYDTLGINTLRGDTGVFIRPSWDRSPTVDFWFKEDGTLQLPAGGDIVDSAGVSVLGGGGANTADVTFSTNVVVGTGYELGLSPGSGFTGDNQYFRVRGGDNPEHLHFDTTDSTLYDLYVGDDSKYFKLSKDGPAVIQSQDQTTAITFNWTFGTDGSLRMPGDITQNSKDATVCFPNADTVIYTSTAQYRHALKLFVMVEGMTDGGGINWDTQACDIIAVRGYNNDIVSVTTYGVTYSGAQPIATFDGQWNATTSRIEITCRPTSTTNVVVSSVHAIEMNSND